MKKQNKNSNHNSLFEKFPKLAAEWHPTKNGSLTPKDVSTYSNQRVWWLLPYDDPETGKHYDFEWTATINNRTRGKGCPYLNGRRVLPGFNDLETKNPKLAAEWHPTKNGELSPRMVTVSQNKKVWWLLPYDDPETGKHYDFEWQATINSRNKGNGCPFIAGKALYSGYNDLATKCPHLVKEWHPAKNETLIPNMIVATSKKKVWWLLHYDDPITGNHFDFEWQARVCDRAKGDGCPFLSHHRAWPGYNDLQTIDPDLAEQWHPNKNGVLTPQLVTPSSNKIVWWLLPYDDPITGKHFDFEWRARINSRRAGCGCPFLNGKAVWPGYNDLATLNPDLAAQWHPDKNRLITPQVVTISSGKKFWWKCKNGHEWRATPRNRSCGQACPYCDP